MCPGGAHFKITCVTDKDLFQKIDFIRECSIKFDSIVNTPSMHSRRQ